MDDGTVLWKKKTFRKVKTNLMHPDLEAAADTLFYQV